MRNTIEIVGIHVDNVTLSEAAQRVETFLETEKLNMVFTPNSEMLVDAVKDREFGMVLNDAQLVIPDGIGVVIASKFYGSPLRERVTGVDLTQKVLEIAANKGKKVYFLGASKDVVEEAAAKVKEKHSNIQIVGVRDGYFSEDEEAEIVADINEKQADILLVALGVPKQEKFIYKYQNQLNAKVAMGIGGTFNILSGRIERAPEFFQKAGLEWLHRLMKEPSRITRMGKLPKFVLLAFYDAKTRAK